MAIQQLNVLSVLVEKSSRIWIYTICCPANRASPLILIEGLLISFAVAVNKCKWDWMRNITCMIQDVWTYIWACIYLCIRVDEIILFSTLQDIRGLGYGLTCLCSFYCWQPTPLTFSIIWHSHDSGKVCMLNVTELWWCIPPTPPSKENHSFPLCLLNNNGNEQLGKMLTNNSCRMVVWKFGMDLASTTHLAFSINVPGS